MDQATHNKIVSFIWGIAAELKLILRTASWHVETAPPVLAKVHKPGKAKVAPLCDRFEAMVDGKFCIVEYEPNGDLRDTEQVGLLVGTQPA